jgi:hypothetical protein
MLMIATKRSTKFYFNGFFFISEISHFLNLGSSRCGFHQSCQDAPRFATLITKISILTKLLSKINLIN